MYSFLLRWTLAFGGFFFSFSLPGMAQSGKPIKIADLDLQVAGTGQPATQLQYAFQAGDVLVLDLENKAKINYRVTVQEHFSASPLYTVQETKKLNNLRLTIPQKSVYTITLQGLSPISTKSHFTLTRIPKSAATQQFNTLVAWRTVQDTTWTTSTEKVLVKNDLKAEVLVDKTFRLASVTNLTSNNRSTERFQLPANTKHWVYWVGVGQESVVALQETGKTLAKGATALLTGSNPLVAFGLGLLPALPQVKSSGYISYYLLNKNNAHLFTQDQDGWKPYAVAKGQDVLSDYGKVLASQTPKTDDGYLYLGFENPSTITGLDLTLKIVAFVDQPVYQTRTVRKPTKITSRREPILAGE
ncbi:hypothetical protein ACD591_18890 [Rufibacter glacialis]|uniref:Uncharacterized protein n=1 Tax=Rufibacter glacialis TaxID=1259555 RepID=A0A5M8QS65_9BACT|nr:hypothetical protein [Rufibacter glacialis]KAA6438108.1 hypothetical protein FOE74_00260 [Rufibacter glacialis]